MQSNKSLVIEFEQMVGRFSLMVEIVQLEYPKWATLLKPLQVCLNKVVGVMKALSSWFINNTEFGYFLVSLTETIFSIWNILLKLITRLR